MQSLNRTKPNKSYDNSSKALIKVEFLFWNQAKSLTRQDWESQGRSVFHDLKAASSHYFSRKLD